MEPNNDYIIVEDSKNLDDDTVGGGDDVKLSSQEASEKTFAEQGITVEMTEKDQSGDLSGFEDFAQELLNEAGIEIMPSNGDNPLE